VSRRFKALVKKGFDPIKGGVDHVRRAVAKRKSHPPDSRGDLSDPPSAPEEKEPAERDTPEPSGIPERVRFREEQERINQVLIPKVLRQHELFTKHIAEHEDLQGRFRCELSSALKKQAREHEKLKEHVQDAISSALERQARNLRRTRWLTIVALVRALVSAGALIVSATGSGWLQAPWSARHGPELR